MGINKGLKLKIGTKFGKWTIISETIERKNNLTLWECQCKCGKVSKVPLNNLMNGSSRQCSSCSKKQTGQMKRNGYKEISGQMWSEIKLKANNKKDIFEINIVDAWDLFVKQNKKCAISNMDIILTGYPYDKNRTSATLITINPNLGYVKENIQWVHKNVAKMKGKLTLNELIDIAYHITVNNAT